MAYYHISPALIGESMPHPGFGSYVLPHVVPHMAFPVAAGYTHQVLPHYGGMERGGGRNFGYEQQHNNNNIAGVGLEEGGLDQQGTPIRRRRPAQTDSSENGSSENGSSPDSDIIEARVID